ncbi:uncharacterized protein Pyn_07682 [Prunus yedoensis var. nudiflora]|uniref:Uncharacterized protein n=1 Tax=Prunus yedoensis var. nudiflora TaxID=2094558 RepID=A0A314YFH3_PRUYE|nr:uncharacterized protein Pyn_07682 [Prunus yedoensis var. nudiflora]
MPSRSSSAAAAPPRLVGPSTSRLATTPATSRVSPTPLAIFARAFSCRMAYESELASFFALSSLPADSRTLRSSISRYGLAIGYLEGLKLYAFGMPYQYATSLRKSHSLLEKKHAESMLVEKVEKERDTIECNFSRFKLLVSILALNDSNRRRTLSMYLLARLAQLTMQLQHQLPLGKRFHFTSLTFVPFVAPPAEVASKDHKLLYWIAGGNLLFQFYWRKRLDVVNLLFSSSASRRFFVVYLSNRHLLPDIKNAECFCFVCLWEESCTTWNMKPDTMAPFLRGLIRRFLASRISNPVSASNRSPSYTYLQSLDAMKKPKLLDSRRMNHLLRSINLESIPGL